MNKYTYNCYGCRKNCVAQIYNIYEIIPTGCLLQNDNPEWRLIKAEIADDKS